MATRMERYHKNENQRVSRAVRNKSLYNDIYSYGRYSNIEGAFSIDKDNVDISKVKEMIDSREKYQSERQYRKLNRDDIEKEIPSVRKRFTEDNNRSYDIMDVLKEAKEKQEPDNKDRVLNTTNYDILKKLNLNTKPVESKEENLKDLIESISNTSMMNKIDDNDLALDMFQDLASDDTKVGDVKDIKQYIEENKAKSDINEKTMDDSFFTSGLKIKNADFGPEKKGSVAGTVFTIIIVLILLGAAAVLLLYTFGYIKF